MRVSDWIADWVRSKGVRHVFGVVGGGAMYLNDSFRDLLIPCHGENAASYAAEAYARLRGFGCVLVTTGPGGTNALSGVACAWVDSVPLLVISGQVTVEQMDARTERQMGVQGLDIVPMASHITKWAQTVRRVDSVQPAFTTAYSLATSGKTGPVWIDVPLDLQVAELP